jgi:hypothetical protein
MTRILFLLVAAGLVAAGTPADEPPDFAHKGIEWLVKAQHENGGWGAGSHARQDIRDPSAVVTDPATTAFVGVALLRAGSTPVSGPHKEAVRRATGHLVKVVEAAPAEGPRITDLEGTQPQTKMGALVDTSMTIHFLARVLRELPGDDPLRGRVDKALDKCLRKIQGSQQADGTWSGGGWAQVLQSSLGCSALELARAAGKDVDEAALERARDHHKGNIGAGGTADATKAAGVELYSFAGGARGAAGQARAAADLLDGAKAEGKIDAEAPMSAAALREAGLEEKEAQVYFEAWRQTNAQADRLGDERLLNGFGNNGGEEYLSYLMMSESLVILGGEKWEKWDAQIRERLRKIQSPDGSWTGHHCITSPVFCTAAVLQTLTVARDAALLREIAAKDREVAVRK